MSTLDADQPHTATKLLYSAMVWSQLLMSKAQRITINCHETDINGLDCMPMWVGGEKDPSGNLVHVL